MPLAKSGHLPMVRKLQPPEKGKAMHNPGQHSASDGNWRPPDLIASLAHGNATAREEHSQNAGIVYMLAELLTALHRQAEALEQLCDCQRDAHQRQDPSHRDR
jgi:hypothetical protein